MYKVETNWKPMKPLDRRVPELPGVLAYGQSRVSGSQGPGYRCVLAERLEHGETLPQVENVFSIVA